MYREFCAYNDLLMCSVASFSLHSKYKLDSYSSQRKDSCQVRATAVRARLLSEMWKAQERTQV